MRIFLRTSNINQISATPQPHAPGNRNLTHRPSTTQKGTNLRYETEARSEAGRGARSSNKYSYCITSLMFKPYPPLYKLPQIPNTPIGGPSPIPIETQKPHSTSFPNKQYKPFKFCPPAT